MIVCSTICSHKGVAMQACKSLCFVDYEGFNAINLIGKSVKYVSYSSKS